MKLKCTALGSCVMTAKPSQRGNDDSEVLKFKDFQGTLTSNSKTFKVLFYFQGLSRSWKNGFFSRTFKAVWPPCELYNGAFSAPAGYTMSGHVTSRDLCKHYSEHVTNMEVLRRTNCIACFLLLYGTGISGPSYTTTMLGSFMQSSWKCQSTGSNLWDILDTMGQRQLKKTLLHLILIL